MNNKIPLLSEGILIGIVSLLGYLLTYVFQMGFASYFSIPIEFINIGLNEILFTTTLAIIIIYITISLSAFFSRAKFKRLFRTLISIFLIVLIIFLKNSAFFIFVFILVIAFVLSPFLQSQFYSKKLIIETGTIETRTKTNTFFEQYLLKKSFFIFAIPLFIIFTYVFGILSAQSKHSFLTTKTKTNTDIVVLAIYNNSIICAPLDRKNKTIEKHLYIFNKDSEDLSILKLERIGPLKVKRSH